MLFYAGIGRLLRTPDKAQYEVQIVFFIPQTRNKSLGGCLASIRQNAEPHSHDAIRIFEEAHKFPGLSVNHMAADLVDSVRVRRHSHLRS